MCCMGRLVRLVHDLVKGKKVAKRPVSYHLNLRMKPQENGKLRLRDYDCTVRGVVLQIAAVLLWW